MIHVALVLFLALGQFAQTNTGELRLSVFDATGAPLQSGVRLASDANQFSETFETDSRGSLIAKRLPFGVYRIAVTRDGFAPFSGTVEIRSTVPTAFRVTLSPAAVAAEVTVTPESTLMDPRQVVAVQRIGAEALRQRMAALPGRALTDLVNTQPGWLVEANGILHPRGSEYQTQYVVDGLPLTDNRSPAFAPEIGAEDVQAMSVLTAGYPAEYGRKLGGVIEVVTAGQARRGFHGSIAAGAGSFATRSSEATAAYGAERGSLGVTAGVAATHRYLDPPVEENFTNRGTAVQFAVHGERDLTEVDRLGAIVRRGEARFTVPNEFVQELAGQRQDRDSGETAAQFSYQRIVSARAVADLRGMVRDLSAGLRSNADATPIRATQDRGFRELYLKGTVSGHAGNHEWKVGGDISGATIRERFGYDLSDPDTFDPGTPASFAYDARARDREQALFVQDQWQRGALTINAGLRFDHYRLIVTDHAFSPRLGVAWSWPKAGLVVRGSYDRAFQTPAVENLLLASDPAVDALNNEVLRVPVRPSRGDFYDAGFAKTLFGKARLDVSQFHRTMDNFADDDLLLNTGVSFPIAFHAARVTGTEIKLHLPEWRTMSGFVSYGRMRGTGELPISGGLFLGDDAAALLEGTERFPLSQDQRHTVRARISGQVRPSLWLALATAYDSGLPVEIEGDPADAIASYGERIVNRVNFDTGRVRPSFSLDASAGLVIARSKRRQVRVQLDVRNLANRLNVINFAGLFSGTAVGAPRSAAIRVQAGF